MASAQLPLKDKSSMTRQKQESTLASITQLLKQPDLTIKKTIPDNVKIEKRTGQKGILNNIGERRNLNNIGEKRTTNNDDEIETVNVIDCHNNKKGTFSNIGQTKTFHDVFRKKPTIPKIGTKYSIQNIKVGSKKKNASPKQNHKGKKEVKMDTEFYPEKSKRNISFNKIVLKPKHKYKVIATTNKRKRCTPVRDTTSTKRFKPSSPITNIYDGLNDEMMMNNDLTDDDLTEILTCESPVWWEALPEGFDEEPIGSQSPSSTTSSLLLTENSALSSKTTKPLTRNTDTGQNQQIKEKQNKLERLLKNIKEIKVKENEVESLMENEVTEKESRSRKHSTDSSDISICDDDLVKCLESVEIPIKITNFQTDDLKENDKNIPILEVKDDRCDVENSSKNNNKLNGKNNQLKNKNVISVEKDTNLPILEIKDDSVVENSTKSKTNINFDKNDLKKNNEKEFLIKNDTEIPIAEIIDDPDVENSSKNKNNMNSKNSAKQISVTNTQTIEIKDDSLENNDIKMNKNEEIFIKKDTKISIFAITDDAVVENVSNNKIILLNNEITKNNSKEILIQKDLEIPILDLNKEDPVVENFTKNKNTMNLEINELKNKSIAVEKGTVKMPILKKKDDSVVENSSKKEQVKNSENNEYRNKNENGILIEKETKIPIMDIKDLKISSDNKKVMNCENNELKNNKEDSIMPIVDKKNCTFVESFSNTLKLSIEKKISVKNNTKTLKPNLKSDDFENEFLKNLIENKIFNKDDKIKLLDMKNYTILRENDEKKELKPKNDPIDYIPFFRINKNETTSCSVEEQHLNLVKKRKKKNTSNTDVQNNELLNNDREISIAVKKDDQSLLKKNTQTSLLLKTNDISKTTLVLEIKKVIPSTSKLNETDNLNKQIEKNIIKIEKTKNIQNTDQKSTSPRKLSPRKNPKRSPNKIKITKFYNSNSNRPKILREDRNRFYVRKIQSQNSDDINKIIQNDVSKDEKSKNNKNRLSLIRQHYLELLSKRSNELSSLNINANQNISINDNNKIIHKYTSITDNNIESNNDFCIQNTSIKFDHKSKSYTNANQKDSSIHFNNIKTDSSLKINSTLNTTDTNTNDSELSIVSDSINCNNIISLDSISCNNGINSESINCNNSKNCNDSINCNNSTKINSEIPLHLPNLIKIPNVASPISIKSINSDSTDENYTISDSNVTYIDEYVDRDKSNELVTVYKILSRPDNDDKSQYLDVPGGNMKYCYNCSTVFDTENCLYCIKKSIQNSGT